MPEEAAKGAKLLAAALRSWDSFSMMGFVREDSGCSQADMSGRLGVGMRKYRELERGEACPDAELLLCLHGMSGYPPSMFMDISDRRMLAVGMIWTHLCEKDKREIAEFIRQLDRLV